MLLYNTYLPPYTLGMKELILDPEDKEEVLRHKWWKQNNSNQIRAMVKGRFWSIGRFVLQYHGPLVVDHINRDIYDNRKENLRVITQRQNLLNRGPMSNSKHSKYKGVTRKGKYWCAIIRTGEKQLTKYLKSEIAAARMYNELAKQHHGKFAYLNDV